MISRLRKQPEKKSAHGYSWIDDYSWIHQDNCLEILRDTNKLNAEVRKHLEGENNYTKKTLLESYKNILILISPVMPHFACECLEIIKNDKALEALIDAIIH